MSFISAQTVLSISTGPDAMTASRIPFQQSSFRAAGLYWAFYGNYSTLNIEYKTSADGVTWSSPTVVAHFAKFAADWTIKFDGTYLHYVRNEAPMAKPVYPYEHRGLYYRRGVPNSDGTITWSAAEQQIGDQTEGYGDMTVGIDSNGRPWIAYIRMSTFSSAIIKSDMNDGTWVTAAGFPHVFPCIGTVYKTTEARLAELENGQMYHIATAWREEFPARGYLWNGNRWIEQGDITLRDVAATVSCMACLNCLGLNNEVHIVYTATNNKIYHRKRNSAGIWTEEIEIGTTTIGDTNDTLPVFAYDEAHNLYVLWQEFDDNNVYMRRCVNGIWHDTIVLFNDSFQRHYPTLMVEHRIKNNRVQLIYQRANNEVIHGLYSTTLPTERLYRESLVSRV